MWISNTTSTDLWLFYFRHVQTCCRMLRHIVASLNMPEIEPPQTFCLVVREPPQISNINDTLLGCICVPLTACWLTRGTYWWLSHESHSAPHVTLCAWLYVQTWQLSLHRITFQLKGNIWTFRTIFKDRHGCTYQWVCRSRKLGRYPGDGVWNLAHTELVKGGTFDARDLEDT